MEQWLQQFYSALPTGPLYYLAIWLIAFLESFLVIGIIVPGSVLIVFSGFLAANGKGDIAILITLAAFGAFVGDFLSYWIGARNGGRLVRHRWVNNYQHSLRRSFSLLREHGAKTIFFGRFLGPLRPFVPFAAGCAHMRLDDFLRYALVSAVLWGFAYPGLGYAVGTSWQRVQVWSGRLGLVVGVGLILCLAGIAIQRWARKEAPPSDKKSSRDDDQD